MKCQNCGKDEVNFHYSSNVNGCVTETHLCSECASGSGYDLGGMFETGAVFDRAFSMLRLPGFLPILAPVAGFGPAFPASMPARTGAPAQSSGCDCGCGGEKAAPEAPGAQVDDEMKKRREMNILREQMRVAAENDDFEKAIELRDSIKEMEK